MDTDKSSSLTGDTFVLLNATSYASYLILVKPLMEKYAPTHVIRWVFLFGAVFIIPLSWNDFNHINWAGFNWTHWLSLGFIVIGATFFAYLFIVYGIAHLGSSVVGSYIYTQPFFATISAIILFNEHLNLIKIIAACLIFSGVYLVNRKKKLSVPEGLESIDGLNCFRIIEKPKCFCRVVELLPAIHFRSLLQIRRRLACYLFVLE